MFIVLVAAAIAGGAVLTWLIEDDWPLSLRLAAGTALGLALQALAGFTLASLFGLDRLCMSLTAVIGTSPLLLLLLRPAFRRRVFSALSARPHAPLGRRARLVALLAFVSGAAALLAVFDRALFVDARGLGTGVESNLGDLPFHLAVIHGFADGANFPPQHPELAGARLTYPLLADFGVALWTRAGAPLEVAFKLQDALLALALALLLYHWALALTRDRRAALLVPALVFLDGGLGFVDLAADAQRLGTGLLGVLMRLPHDHTIRAGGELRWGNALTTLLIPQRALLLGLPLSLVVWTLWWRALERPPGTDRPGARRALLAAGGVAGLLPLAHTHLFVVAVGAGSCLALLFRAPRAWTAFFAAAAALALPQVLWLSHGSGLDARRFIDWQFGWDRGRHGALAFWLFNTGLLLPLLAVACARLVPSRLLRFYLAFLPFFVAPNLLRLSPWIWDNVKFLFPWFVASTPLVALVPARLSRAGGPGRLACAALVAGLTLSGALDVWRVVSRQVTLILFTPAGLELARAVAARTPPGARLLHLPTFDAPSLLSGRPSVLGYPGHIWSLGLAAGTREADVRRIYTGAPEAARLLRRHAVDFLLLGPQERAALEVNAAFLGRFPVALASGPYLLYDVRQADGASTTGAGAGPRE